MRRILVDAARARGADKRGGGAITVNLDVAGLVSSQPHRSILALDEALTAFAALAPRQAKVVELRYFGGLTEEEIVAALNISPRTVRRDWDLAKAWLLRELSHKIEQPTAHDPQAFPAGRGALPRRSRANGRRTRSVAGRGRARRASRSRVAALDSAGGEFLERPAIHNAARLLDESTLDGLPLERPSGRTASKASSARAGWATSIEP